MNENKTQPDTPEIQEPEHQHIVPKIWLTALSSVAIVVGWLVYANANAPWPFDAAISEMAADPPAVMSDEDAQPMTISYDPSVTQWVTAEFPKPQDPFYDVAFQHPEGWIFSCCGDKDTESNHFVLPPGTKPDDFSGPRIVVTDHRLVGCPAEHDDQCSFGEFMREIDAPTFFERRTADLKEEMSEVGTVDLPQFEVPVHIVVGDKAFPSQTVPVKMYLILTGDDVVTVQFQDYQRFPEELIDDFLKRVEVYK